MKIKTRLGLSRVGMGKDTVMRFEIEDSTSGTRIADISIDMEQFAFLVSGLHGIEADCELYSLENVGKVYEHKVVNIDAPTDMPRKVDDDVESIEDLLSPYEVDGWKANVSDLFNHHKRDARGEGDLRQHFYKVGFGRFVDADK